MQRTYIPYKKTLKALASKLRTNATVPEILFWETCLKNRKSGFKFLRQKPLDIYIADFYCAELLLVIEIDGPNHLSLKTEDQIRSERLQNFGIKVLRYDNDQVLSGIEDLEVDLKKQIHKRMKDLALIKQTP